MFTWRRFILVVSVIAAYVVTATLVGFYIMGPPDSSQWALQERSMEVVVLWTLLWSLVGCYAGMRETWSGRRAGAAVAVFAPVLIMLPWAVITSYHAVPKIVTTTPFAHPLWFKVLLGVLCVIPLVLGAFCTILLRLQIGWWKRAMRKGICRNCFYDLTGNVSGICPECGTPIQKPAAPDWTIGGRRKLDIRWLNLIGLYLFVVGSFLFRAATYRSMAYVLFAAGVLFISAFVMLLRKIGRRERRIQGDQSSTGTPRPDSAALAEPVENTVSVEKPGTV